MEGDMVSLTLLQAVGEVVRIIEEPSSPGLKLVVQQAQMNKQLFDIVEQLVDGATADATVNLSVPADVWVQEAKAFTNVTPGNIRRWTGAGREFWMYHCCCYDMASCMNSMTEWPAAISRLMPWLAVANGGTGWLYYAVNEWLPVARIEPDSKGYCTEGVCSEWANHSAVATRAPGGSARTTFRSLSSSSI